MYMWVAPPGPLKSPEWRGALVFRSSAPKRQGSKHTELATFFQWCQLVCLLHKAGQVPVANRLEESYRHTPIYSCADQFDNHVTDSQAGWTHQGTQSKTAFGLTRFRSQEKNCLFLPTLFMKHIHSHHWCSPSPNLDSMVMKFVWAKLILAHAY